MAAGVTGSDAYSEGFRWRAAEQREGSAADVARDIAAALDTEYSTIDWRGTVAAIRTAASAGTPAPTES